jgi:ferritin-like metal-binding protein YciE
MQENGLSHLYVDQLRDLHNAESQLVKALPKMAKAASSPALKQGFEKHLLQTKGHVDRLEQIFAALDESPKGKKCAGMEGLIEEGEEIIKEIPADEGLDAGLVAAAQRVEHYEIAAYGTVRNFAELLGDDEAATLLQQTLDEEKETDEKLTEISKDVNTRALESCELEEKQEEASPRRAKRHTKARSAHA